MGRSVATVRGSTTIAYVDQSELGYVYDEETNTVTDEYDECQGQFEWECYEDNVVEQICDKWKSMEDVREDNEWHGNECKVIARNNLCDITISSYCGLVALCLVPRTDDHEDGTGNLCESFARRIAPNFDKMFGEINRVGGFSDGTSVYERKETA